MPAYPYECMECETHVEITKSIHAPETIPTCPKCGYTMVRVWESTPVQFKGGGFYSTGG